MLDAGLLLWSKIQARSDHPLAWFVRQVLCEKPLAIEQVYRQIGTAHIQPIDEFEAQDFPRDSMKYLNSWNAARNDLLIETKLTLPDRIYGATRIVTNCPDKGPLAYWLCNTLMGLDDDEIRSGIGSLKVPENHYIPMLKTILHEARLHRNGTDPLLDGWLRSRYLVLRYFMDATYHEV